MNLIICGAAGRDFHTFNVLYRQRDDRTVVAFTATQIPNIDGRVYPLRLAGPRYPQGIQIRPEEELPDLIRAHRAEEVIFAYSDVPHERVMHVASIALAAGATFILPSPESTMLASRRPVISVCAVRTGSGKSQITRAIARLLTRAGLRAAVVRHPMPYGDLEAQRVQRFATLEDLERHHCTIEEMEEYEPHLQEGRVVYAGVDYAAVLELAERDADVILWEGGNNDTPFFRSDLEVVVADPHRPGHELRYHPGETNLRRADVVVINKVDSADPEAVSTVAQNAARVNPAARILRVRSSIHLDRPDLVRGKRVLVVEDGPTLTHGEMAYGAGTVAARRFGAAAIVDPRPWVVGAMEQTFLRYPDIGPLLPAMGYGQEQIADLARTIERADCDTVIVATPVDLARLVHIGKPCARVRYELDEDAEPELGVVVTEFLKAKGREAKP
jgi:predicted GTPase